MVVPARRGTITDHKGVELAVSEPADDIAVTPYLIKDPAGAARRLAPLLHQPLDKVLQKVAQRGTGFVYLTRSLPASQAQKIGKLKMPGIQLIPSRAAGSTRSAGWPPSSWAPWAPTATA